MRKSSTRVDSMRIKHISFIFLVSCLITFLYSSPLKKKDPWKEWLDSVSIIMTRSERMVFKILKTEEEHDRFKEMFWKARDPNPRTPQNEYKSEFFRRVGYAKRRLRGIHSDRGKIYIILGKPFDKISFTGHENLVECELWEYRPDEKLGLVPFFNLLFFKQRDSGDFKLFHPGIHKPSDILSPMHSISNLTQYKAFMLIKENSNDLALASLSMIPGEGDPRMNTSLSSSNFILGRIYSVPEKEAESGYIRNFKSGKGYVNIEHSTDAIQGYGNISISKVGNIKFLNYAVMPEQLNLMSLTKDLYSAKINLYISIEDLNGSLVYQKEREIDLRYTAAERKQVEERKIVFRDFVPIINGEFNIKIAFLNKTTKDFYTYQEKLNMTAQSLPVLLGYKNVEKNTEKYISFGSKTNLILSDPRAIFNQNDILTGIVFCSQVPEISLKKVDNQKELIKVENITKRGNYFIFNLPLKGIKDSNYLINIRSTDGKTFTQKIHLFPLYIKTKKPFYFEKKEPESTRDNYIFLLAQEYLNIGKVEKAIEYFNKLPRYLWNSQTLPVVARAYYLNKDYAQVVKLLEAGDVKKSYYTIFILANSSIELKRYKEAIKYLEELRKYEDTVNINQLLAATYLVLGKKEKARAYYERARNLEKTKK